MPAKAALAEVGAELLRGARAMPLRAAMCWHRGRSARVRCLVGDADDWWGSADWWDFHATFEYGLSLCCVRVASSIGFHGCKKLFSEPMDLPRSNALNSECIETRGDSPCKTSVSVGASFESIDDAILFKL